MFKTEKQRWYFQIEDFENFSISKQPQICIKKMYLYYLFIFVSFIMACCFVWAKYFQQ